MQIKEIWRYPVKSMAGETLSVADINRQGIAGDRIIQVRNAGGRIFSARTRPKLLRHTAMLADNGDVLVSLANQTPLNLLEVLQPEAETVRVCTLNGEEGRVSAAVLAGGG